MHTIKPNHTQSANVKSEPAGKYTNSVCTPQQEQLALWLKNVKFKRCFGGGVSEKDVWQKIEELHTLYMDALDAEKIRIEAWLQADLQLKQSVFLQTDKENTHVPE